MPTARAALPIWRMSYRISQANKRTNEQGRSVCSFVFAFVRVCSLLFAPLFVRSVSKGQKERVPQDSFLFKVLTEELPNFGGGVHAVASPVMFTANDLVEPHLITIYATHIAVCDDLILYKW